MNVSLSALKQNYLLWISSRWFLVVIFSSARSVQTHTLTRGLCFETQRRERHAQRSSSSVSNYTFCCSVLRESFKNPANPRVFVGFAFTCSALRLSSCSCYLIFVGVRSRPQNWSWLWGFATIHVLIIVAKMLVTLLCFLMSSLPSSLQADRKFKSSFIRMFLLETEILGLKHNRLRVFEGPLLSLNLTLLTGHKV